MSEAIRVSLISLGCARNLVDSEVLLGHAAEEGLVITRDPEDADVVVVNTCGFVEESKQESIDTILEVCKLKGDGGVKAVVAVGCLAQRYADDLRAGIPELDAVFGISDYSGIPKIVRELAERRARGTRDDERWIATVDGGAPKSARSDLGRVLLTPKSYAYLRISEGCDHTCSFCAIPGMRGKNRSKPEDVLVEEATALTAQGVKEIVVVAEDSTAYGLDTHRERRIHLLLERLAEVRGVEWLRLMYAYPHTVRPELTALMAGHPRIVPYLDIPVQHVSGPMLRAMRRGVSSQQVRGILARLRDEVPGIAVRTTFIVGFPGETDADHAELREFVRDYRFERMGVFTYSHEEGTRAFALDDDVPAELKEERRAELMTLQKGIIREQQRRKIGTVLRVLVDGRDPDGDGFVARTTADAPEVDCVVRLGVAELPIGGLVDVRVTGVDDYDLVAEPVGADG